jgi:hypothetical protein
MGAEESKPLISQPMPPVCDPLETKITKDTVKDLLLQYEKDDSTRREEEDEEKVEYDAISKFFHDFSKVDDRDIDWAYANDITEPTVNKDYFLNNVKCVLNYSTNDHPLHHVVELKTGEFVFILIFDEESATINMAKTIKSLIHSLDVTQRDFIRENGIDL